MALHRVPRNHTTTQKRNRGRYLLWFAIPLLKMVPISNVLSGCGPKQGQEGGDCYKSQSCNKDDYCNDGLVCQNGTCVAGSSDSYRETMTPLPACCIEGDADAGESQ